MLYVLRTIFSSTHCPEVLFNNCIAMKFVGDDDDDDDDDNDASYQHILQMFSTAAHLVRACLEFCKSRDQTQ